MADGLEGHYMVQNDAGVSAEKPEAVADPEAVFGARNVEAVAVKALRNWCPRQ